MSAVVKLFRALLLFIVEAWCCPSEYVSHRKAHENIKKHFLLKQEEDNVLLGDATAILRRAMNARKFKYIYPSEYQVDQYIDERTGVNKFFVPRCVHVPESMNLEWDSSCLNMQEWLQFKFSDVKNYEAMKNYSTRPDFLLKDTEIWSKIDWASLGHPTDPNQEVLHIFYQLYFDEITVRRIMGCSPTKLLHGIITFFNLGFVRICSLFDHFFQSRVRPHMFTF
jgi:hypothetical protein